MKNETGVTPVPLDKLRKAVVSDISRKFNSEEGIAQFLKAMGEPWELMCMAENSGRDTAGFWNLGVRQWLEADHSGERLHELRRVFHELCPDDRIPGTVM